MIVETLSIAESTQIRARWVSVFGEDYFAKFGKRVSRFRDAAYWKRPKVLRDTRAEYFLMDHLHASRFMALPDDGRLCGLVISAENDFNIEALLALSGATEKHLDLMVLPLDWTWTGIFSEDAGPWVIRSSSLDNLSE
jgi:hypothetical protein